MENKIYEDFGQFELIESNCFYEKFNSFIIKVKMIKKIL